MRKKHDLLFASAILAITSATLFLVAPVLGIEGCSLDTNRAYKAPGSATVYYVTDTCKKRAFTRSDVFKTYFTSWSEVTETRLISLLPDDPLGFMPWGPLYSPVAGSLIKTVSDPKVYVVLDDEVRWITSEFVFSTLGYDYSWIEDVDARVIQKYTPGGEITDVSHHPLFAIIKYKNSSAVFQVLAAEHPDEKLRAVHIPNEGTFTRLGFRFDRIIEIDDVLANSVYKLVYDSESLLVDDRAQMDPHTQLSMALQLVQ